MRSAASPHTDGLVEVVSSVMGEGWDQQSAGRVGGYSLGAYCPDLLGQWAKAVDEL
ncbi:hypothetical protein MCNF_22280 [Mycolicibacterium confluentis]|uniref:Uncharacterized protein n=1 Tax=Mycolicibacterium confluentis TaxID=28047 RepID=A0A7I7XXD4_9MYCO|nr:hypothetical protein MCNF_22280 [Mycolicibacterium confluentis]